MVASSTASSTASSAWTACAAWVACAALVCAALLWAAPADADETQGARPEAGKLLPAAPAEAPNEAAPEPPAPMPAAPSNPRWTALRTLLAAERGDGGGRVVEVVDLARRSRLVVEGSEPSLSPSGSHFLVRRPTGAAGAVGAGVGAPDRLVLVELPSGRELALPGASPRGEAPAWAADGERLLATLVVPGSSTPEVFLLDLRGETPKLHQVSSGGARSGRWLGAGDRVTFVGRDPGEAAGREVLWLRDGGGLGAVRRFWTDLPAAPEPPARAPSPEPGRAPQPRFDPERIS